VQRYLWNNAKFGKIKEMKGLDDHDRVFDVSAALPRRE
jgi:hypothetical protein